MWVFMKSKIFLTHTKTLHTFTLHDIEISITIYYRFRGRLV